MSECVVCPCLEYGDDDLYCCIWDNRIMYAFDLDSLSAGCKKEKGLGKKEG